MAVIAHPAVSRSGARAVRTGSLHLHLAYACAAVGVLGFAPSFWWPLLTGRFDLAPILYVHAAVFYGWLALFVVQARMIAARRMARHREIGVLGVSVATAMCFVGVAAAVNSMRQSAAAGFGDQARAFSVVPLTGIAFFAVLFAVAVVNVRRPEVHKRVMLVATVSLLNAAVGRLFLLVIGAPPPAAGAEPPPVFVTVPAGLITDLLLLPALWHDWKTRGRVHPAYWVAGLALVASQVLRIPVAATPAWQAVAGWISTLLP
jgi:hypothetical protein